MGLVNNPWFYTPPFQPMGVNHPTDGTLITGFDVAKFEAAPPPVFAFSEFEYREALRLHPDGQAARFIQTLNQRYNHGETYPIAPEMELALPGRQFVPHDYLYPNPKTSVYLREVGP